MSMEVNYKNKKFYSTAKYPIRQPLIIVWLIWLLSRMMLVVAVVHHGNYLHSPFWNFRKKRKVPLETNSLHIEYDYCYIKPFDCVDISTETDSFYCYPRQENVVTKLAFATEELYQRSLHRKKTAITTS